MPKRSPAADALLLQSLLARDTEGTHRAERNQGQLHTRKALMTYLVEASADEIGPRMAWANWHPHLIRPTLATLAVITTALMDRHPPDIQDAWIALLPRYLFDPGTVRGRRTGVTEHRYAHAVIAALGKAEDPTVWVRAHARWRSLYPFTDHQPLSALREDAPERLDVPRLSLWLKAGAITLDQLKQTATVALNGLFCQVDRLPAATFLAQAKWLADHGADLTLPLLRLEQVPVRFHTGAATGTLLREMALAQRPAVAPTRPRYRA